MSKQKSQIISKLKQSFFFLWQYCHLITRSAKALMLVSSSSPSSNPKLFLAKISKEVTWVPEAISFSHLEMVIKRREKEKETCPLSPPRREKITSGTQGIREGAEQIISAIFRKLIHHHVDFN